MYQLTTDAENKEELGRKWNRNKKKQKGGKQLLCSQSIVFKSLDDMSEFAKRIWYIWTLSEIFWYTQSWIFHRLQDSPKEEGWHWNSVKWMAAQEIQTVPQFLPQISCTIISKSVHLSLPQDPICNGTINLLPPFRCWLLNQNKRFSEAEVVPCYKLPSTFCTTEVWSHPCCNK